MTKNAQEVVAKLLEADDPPPEHYMNRLPVRFDQEELRRALQHEASAWCMDSPEDKQAFLAWMQTHANLFPDFQYAVDVVTANDAWCFDAEADIDRFISAINPQHSDYAKSNFERFAAAIGAENEAEQARVLAQFKRAARGYIIWAHAGDEQGAGYDPADLARLRKAKTFEEAEAVLAQYETQPSFLSMVAQGYFV